MRRLLPFLALLLSPPLFAAGPTGLLNDTGQTTCYESSALVTCIDANAGDAAAYPRQDGRFGRDRASIAKVGGGAAGFDFTKICTNGQAEGVGSCPTNPTANTGPIPAATEWACTRDNVTNLIWSLETVSGIADWADATNSAAPWPIYATNNGFRCGFSAGWRVPTHRELLSIVHRGMFNPAIDTAYFPGTSFDTAYWSNDTILSSPESVWDVQFEDGRSDTTTKIGGSLYLRLVHDGP